MTYNPYRQKPAQYAVAKEGHPFILAGLVAAVIFMLLGMSFLAVPCFLFAAFAVYFFRNPERVSSAEADAIISPADGKVIFVGNAPSPISKRESLKISIFMSVLNVHVNRYPVSGKVKRAMYFPGKFFVASLDKASERNERCALLIESNSGHELEVVQIAGLVARRIVCYSKEGSEFERGDRLGLIRFGSRLDVYLPVGSSVDVKVGQKVSAGLTKLGRFS